MRISTSGIARIGLVLCAFAVLAACSSSRGLRPSSRAYGLNDKIPEGGGYYKVGKPYVIDGKTYYPKEDPNYVRTGIASWYGEAFHGRKTANGEYYDMNRLSAAHRTMPLPSYAKITNLRNGRAVIVRVNDRGPYAREREIDMSKAAAKVLAFTQQGTTRVKVEYMGPAPLEGDGNRLRIANQNLVQGHGMSTASLLTGQDSKKKYKYHRRGTPENANPSSLASNSGNGQLTPKGEIYVQAASFSDPSSANALKT
ncbi:MAG TPA: septal ring lytic transglycosylase RlpA family protein, partial [Rhizobiales bacterium]|nr:septal ring lytic transglycosylase RlpA family protein [Hyphomicrobiales bacterium]